MSRPPDRAKTLKKNLSDDRNHQPHFERIARGILDCHKYSMRLIDDVKCLAKERRYSSAQFLLATTKEEVAKLYILADMCRTKIGSEAFSNLSKAFYNHVQKHAYFEAICFQAKRHMCRDSFDDLRQLWTCETRQLWPSSPETGEPDIPHATYFYRELPLYCDFEDYGQKWIVPNNDLWKSIIPEGEHDPNHNVTRHLDAWNKVIHLPDFVDILSRLYKQFHEFSLSDQTCWKEIQSRYKQVESMLPQHVRYDFSMSALCCWPIYPCLEKKV